MSFEDDMISAGHTKILKDQKYFVVVNDDGNPIGGIDDKGEPAEIQRGVDDDGNMRDPHVWVPAGRKLKAYKGNNKADIKSKIKNKEPHDVFVMPKEEIKK